MATPKPTPESQSSRSLNRQLVLDEDEYTAALSRIIARDFFPTLVDLDPEVQDSGDIHASVRRQQDINITPIYSGEPGETPYGLASETPLHTPRGEPPSKRTRYDTSMSLDSFQAKYTSEDNSSFTQILDEENRQRKERWGWAWAAQRRVEEQRERMLEGRERGLIEAPPAVGVRERRLIDAPLVAGLITNGQSEEAAQEETDQSTSQVAVIEKKLEMITKGDDEKEPLDVMAPKKDTRSAGVDGWKFKTRNSLMFSPDADIAPYTVSDSNTISKKAQENPGVIKHGNTRLPEEDESRPRGLSAPPSPTHSRVAAAITGTPYRPRSPTTGSYPLVPNIPSPTPSDMGPKAVKQLMTWGTLNATPRILSQSDDPAEAAPPPSTPFHLPAPSSRETISHQLSARASRSLRAKAGLLGLASIGQTPIRSSTPHRSSGKSGSMGPPTWTPRRADAPGNLTPAAKRLLDRTSMKTAAVRRAEAMSRTSGWEGNGKGKDVDLNRVRWTPTPNISSRGG
ncbi:hypothetical protein SERLA73DRAFT_187770 [Serpula lacrymans var. lacrymans S7.3]|uniref:Nuclear protein DGCR14 n=2 Tax=Serpula lacrymans var. lacrymans TaxID=341189 RepID=F8QAC0_SERL3|nr:uncharacterized protein SERLADRAFT_477561 [Serpula lacrymans var. lacrymans S7.9]EGN94710.1 hypothetical protein SERLA73DRAFT_187770 [Serpula lacrymans var. lacrymans S7.3]EGO20189.1 hypothetical protein SERLADRAFT_477561 [Serpula lacrymans var. lacrymans S7.9]